MRPGQTRTPSSHKTGQEPAPRIPGILITMLLLSAIVGILPDPATSAPPGGIITTTASGDGMVLSSSTWTAGEAIITGRILGTGLTSLIRETAETREHSGDSSASSTLTVTSAGPILAGEYARMEEPGPASPPACIFAGTLTGTPPEEKKTAIRATALLRHGNYSRIVATRPAGAGMLIDGEGLADISHELTGRQNITSRTLVTGNLSIREEIRA